MRAREILLTFDYELFLGSKSGLAEDCILKPSKRILETLEKHQAKAIFFVDTTYLWKLRKDVNANPSHLQTFEKIKKQILEISKSHYVYLHMHPHWIDATFEPDTLQWNLTNANKFTIHNLDTSERNSLLKECYEILTECSEQAVEGYRAGGLFIQPFTDIKDFFIESGITYEFSVYKGFQSVHQHMKCDFSNAPNEHIYPFEDDICEVNTNGRFTQFSISNFEMSGMNRIVNSIYYRYIMRQSASKPYGTGKGAQHVLSNNEKHTSVMDTVHETFSVELMNLWKNRMYLSYLKQHEYLHFLSHPKLISETNLNALDSFLTHAKKYYQVEFDFKKFKR
jgi:hypothetical protein